MNTKALLQLLRLGEGLQTEFKVQMPKLSRLAKTFSAFSNSSGGRVFFGVDDRGKIASLANVEGTLELANQVAQFYCNPPIELQHQIVSAGPGQDILIVHVEESDSKPVYAVDPNRPSDAWPYFRSHSENLPIDKKSLRTMRRIRATDLDKEFADMSRHEQHIINLMSRKPRQTIRQLARSCNIGSNRAKHIVVELEKNGWVYSFFNEKKREYSLAVPWKKNG
ncbi:MAG: hypothetical protein CSA81_07085 [Acidobacteria bacterium]|nr:MAG: hypothetical protein CSA81_07085 [Acidobacteriota bacterium]